MTLSNKIKELYKATSDFVKKEKDYCTSACLFITTRGFDTATTLMGMSQNGKTGEVFPVSDYFMDLYGGSAGLAAEQLSIGTFFLALAYYLNEKELKGISGNRILNGASIVSLGIGTVNLLDYFNAFTEDSPIIRCLSNIF